VTKTLFGIAVLALAIASTALAGTNSLPLRDPAGLARVHQEYVNRRIDPAGRCRVLTRYAVRCVSAYRGMRVIEVLSKAGTHRLRSAISFDGGKPRIDIFVLRPSNTLYPYV